MASPIVATAVVAVSSPTPGISAMAWHALSCLIHTLSRCSILPICSSNFVSSLYRSRNVSISMAGNRSASFSSAAGISLSKAARLAPITSPYSVSKPRSALICMVRILTNCCRTRCMASTACWSSVLTATALQGCCTASQIALASAASLLLPMLNALTRRAGISLTSCPSFTNSRAQCCAPPHASMPIRHGKRLAKYSRNPTRLIALFTISPVSRSTWCT